MIPALWLYKGVVNVRDRAALTGTARFTTAAGDAAAAIGVSEVVDADGHRWVEGDFGDRGQGWTRDDKTFAIGDFRLLGHPTFGEVVLAERVFPAVAPAPLAVPLPTGEGKYQAPLGQYIITQGYGVNGHRGEDLGVSPGGTANVPVFARAKGEVYRVLTCTQCRDDAPNLASQGKIYTPAIGNDLSWGFGFGHCVVLRIARAAWPADAQGTDPAYQWAYVTLGHLKDPPLVAVGQAVTNGTQLGLRGMTGNATGPHLHLQVLLSKRGNVDNPFNGDGGQSGDTIVDPGGFYAL